jgi:hypothetical protein
MQDVARDFPAPLPGAPGLVRTYAQPLSGLRVSWGSVLAGTAALLAVSLILWTLALAIIAVVMHPTLNSLKVSGMILWVSGIATTLIGAFVGGWLAGYLPGNPRRGIGVAHGFLTWCVAMIVSFGFQLFLFRGMVTAATTAAMETAAAGGETSGVALQVEGMPRTQETQRMQGMPGMQGTPGMPGAPGVTRIPGGGPGPQGNDAIMVRTALQCVAGMSWSWFGTWFLAGLLSIAGARAGVRRIRKRELPPPPERLYEEERAIAPLTPAPTP